MTVTAIIAEMFVYWLYVLKLIPLETAIGLFLLIVVAFLLDWIKRSK